MLPFHCAHPAASFISVVPLSPCKRHCDFRRKRHPSLCFHTQSNSHPLLNQREAQLHFLQTTWGKTPKLFRSLLSFDNPLNPDDLAGLATETPYARIIRGSGNGPYSLALGPFSDETFQTLGHTDWTLLVDHVNRHFPELSNLLDTFNFLPNWRLDDIMLSYAAPGGSVGPHVDNYDVFLLQASGRRLWKTSYTPISNADERVAQDLDVRVLDGGFVPDEEWILEPGDALYVPPRFPHHGISLDDQCMTYSIGFRAPTVASLMTGWVDYIVETKALHDTFYEDSISDLIASIGDAGRISHGAAEKAFTLVMNHLMEGKKEDFMRWFAQEVSQPKAFLDMEPLSEKGDAEMNLKRIFEEPWDAESPILIRQREGSVFTFLEDSDDVSMYIDGERWPVASVNIAVTICGKRCRSALEYAELAKQHSSVPELLRKLLEADILYIAEFVKEELSAAETVSDYSGL